MQRMHRQSLEEFEREFEAKQQKEKAQEELETKLGHEKILKELEYERGKNPEHLNSPYETYHCKVTIDLCTEYTCVNEESSTGTLKIHDDNRIDWEERENTTYQGVSDVIKLRMTEPTLRSVKEEYSDNIYGDLQYKTFRHEFSKTVWKNGRVTYTVQIDELRSLTFEQCRLR